MPFNYVKRLNTKKKKELNPALIDRVKLQEENQKKTFLKKIYFLNLTIRKIGEEKFLLKAKYNKTGVVRESKRSKTQKGKSIEGFSY